MNYILVQIIPIHPLLTTGAPSLFTFLHFKMTPHDNIRIAQTRPLLAPSTLIEEVPLTKLATAVIDQGRKESSAILRGDDAGPPKLQKLSRDVVMPKIFLGASRERASRASCVVVLG